MYCKACYYNLRSTSTGPCPECGRAFNRDDAKTFSLSTDRLLGPLSWLTIIASSIPSMLMISILVTWCVAALVLGHWPVPYQDDPKYINNGLVTFCYWVTMILIIIAPFAVLATVVMLIVLSKGIAKVPRRGRCFLTVLAIAVANIAFAYVVIRFVFPSEIGDWLMD